MNFNKLRKYFKEKNISQDAVAIKIGRTPSGLKKMLARKNMTIVDLESISNILGVSAAYWWSDEDNVLREQEIEYERTHKKTVDMLTDTIAYFKNKCELLEGENRQLKGENPQSEKRAL